MSGEMITVDKYLPYIEFELHPSPENVAAAQAQALDTLVDEFASDMKAKLHAKAKEGYSGWDDPSFAGDIAESLHRHVERGTDQYVDMANLAAMLWNMGREE